MVRANARESQEDAMKPRPQGSGVLTEEEVEIQKSTAEEVKEKLLKGPLFSS